MLLKSHTTHLLHSTSGAWQVVSLSDGYLDMPSDLLRDTQNKPVPEVAQAGPHLRLSVNCFALAGPDPDQNILIDCGGGGWAATVGRLEQTMAEAGIQPASITILALTHTHQDHLNGLLTPDGRTLFPNLKLIAISADAVESFREDPQFARFEPLLRPIRSGEYVTEQLRAVALPGHAVGHTGYALDTGEDRVLFFGDVVHVPALQFANPSLSWGFDDDQPAARATRLSVFQEAAKAGTWIAGAHLGRPGIGRVIYKGNAYSYDPLA